MAIRTRATGWGSPPLVNLGRVSVSKPTTEPGELASTVSAEDEDDDEEDDEDVAGEHGNVRRRLTELR